MRDTTQGRHWQCGGGGAAVLHVFETTLAFLTANLVVTCTGEAGTGNVVEAVRHCRAVMGAIKQLQTLDDDEIYVYAKVYAVSLQSQAFLCGHT